MEIILKANEIFAKVGDIQKILSCSQIAVSWRPLGCHASLVFVVQWPDIIKCSCDARVMVCYTPQSAVVPPCGTGIRLIEVFVSYAFVHL